MASRAAWPARSAGSARSLASRASAHDDADEVAGYERVTCDVAGGRLCYWVHRAVSPQLPWVVLLPGLTADHTLFAGLLEPLARRWNVIAWDAPGPRPSGMAPAKPDPGFDLIPMWVADMNFAVVPTVQEELIRRVQHPTFGYFAPTKEYYESIIRWQNIRNGAGNLKAGMIGFDSGVLSGVISAVNVLCSRGDRILIHTPTYIGFTKALENNGYCLIHSPLIFGDDQTWRMDFQDME